MILSLTLEKKFSAAHLYRNPRWTSEQNTQEFGLCYSQYGHGHNYLLKIEIPITTLAEKEKIKLKVSNQVNSIIQNLDHKHLNFEVSFFQNKNPTTENIARYLGEQLSEKKISWLELRLFETEQICVELKNDGQFSKTL